MAMRAMHEHGAIPSVTTDPEDVVQAVNDLHADVRSCDAEAGRAGTPASWERALVKFAAALRSVDWRATRATEPSDD